MKKFISLFSLVCLVHLAIAQYSFDTDKLVLDLKALSADDMEGRRTGSKGNKKAMDLIINELQELAIQPLVPGYIQSFSFTKTNGSDQSVSGSNILGVIQGHKKETIVISAHYDHVGINNNEVYNGADDNASGTAALLTMIKFFWQNAPTHRIIFAFFDAEEMGLKGSAHFVNSIDLSSENIVLNINLDMVARSDKNTIYTCGGYHYPQLKKILEQVKTPTGITLGFGHDDPALRKDDWTAQSDHYNFHLKKIPFVYFGVEDHADYHRPTDDFEKVNPTFYSNSVETILQSVIAFDKYLRY